MLPTATLRTTLRLTFAASVAAAVTGLAGCTNETSDMSGMDHGSSNSASPTAPSTPAATTASIRHPGRRPTQRCRRDVRPDDDPAPHQTIQMSDMILAKDGINSEITELAQQIKDAQAPEIAQMSGWLAGWGQNPSPSMGMDHDMDGGTMTQAEMDALETASGDEATRLFLTGMIKHHQGAITMAEAELADGQTPEAKQLAQDIITAQRAEITTMNQLLTQL